MAGYHFDEELFKINFKAKDSGAKSEDSARLNHVPDKCFKLYPYKAATRKASPIVYDFSEVISGFFRKALGITTDALSFDDLCQCVLDKVQIDDEEDIEYFKDIIRALFFKGDNFQANNIGLYPYQITVENKSADRIADYLFCVLGLDENDKLNIENAGKEYPFNVLEKMVVDSIETRESDTSNEEAKYYQIKNSIQDQFKSDFEFMLKSGMTSIDDISNLLAFYYFYYTSQSILTLDQFGNGDHGKLETLYYALDWEKVSKNRHCCTDGWDKLSNNISRMFSHAITLEILNQNDGKMMDYIDFKNLADENEAIDEETANEIKRAEQVYTSYIGDCKKFDTISNIPGANKTDSAIRHLFECVLLQFNETDRSRASQFYAEKFSEFCKARFVKNRKKSGLVLNLTERDIIFLTKLALRNEEKIRLNELYKQYELRGVYLDTTSKGLLQDFFTKLNLIDKKSDSGDAQYVKRIL
ncbi:MAG: DNA phosphorothioation-dependent restriction protein DptG [Butyrivibrio sp.]|uniref:DNA phosphorothioation-dependent restriction protein DptG n=1 Tax=Butyrivibrio sp. TaxID=28121 RepID=UPI0025CE4D62|nr:DNA phosphorothioation-dependent restriction protein DptG [Butyrivibrio sp.]MCR5769671.1 DNA phosphorothioation-dependent restriction protein DptG [Butyrivibrio sp.]